MNGKQFLKNITLDNAFYIAQSEVRKRTWSKEALEEIVSKKEALCPECAAQKACIYCGCQFPEMLISDKPCPQGKF